MKLLVTGVPGCGKTVLSKKLAKLLNARLIDVNKVVDKHKLYEKNEKKERLVDVKKLEKVLKPLITGNVIVESHLLCEMKLPCDKIIVLRCSPLVLKKRLEKRRYPAWKIKENVVAELLDYCSIKASENYPESKILEVDFTKPISAEKVLLKKKSDRVNWMGDFQALGSKIKGFWT